jgi:transposase
LRRCLVPASQTALLPPEARPISLIAGIQEDYKGGAVFVYGWATMSWEAGDEASRRLAALQLVRLKVANQKQVAAGFATDPATLWRWEQAHRARGLAGLLSERPGPRGPHKLTPEVSEELRGLEAQGLTLRQISERTQLSTDTIRRALGRVTPRPGSSAPAQPSVGQAPATEQSAVELPAVPQPVPRLAERQAARAGLMEEAAPVITEGRELPLAGLLLILPALAEVGLLEIAQQVYGRLRNGFYGLRSMLLTLAFLALLREPRAEGATRIAPPDLGRVLGLDRAPEVKTIRRRLGHLAERGLGEKLVFGLASKHADSNPQALGFLYMDGHVRAYSGTRRLPKAHIARARISAPATVETWAADANGDPVFVVVAPVGASMVSEVRRLLPELRQLVGERRLTVCFDRGGWSPELFYEIIQAGFDFLTYRKATVSWEPARAFAKQSLVADGKAHEYELADRRTRLRLPARKGWPKTLTVRQVTRRRDDHQTPIVTSRTDLSAVEVAHRMFSRWRQENYFRYGRQHFALDALDSYASQPDDLERTVPNPQRARLRRQLARAQQQLDELEATLGAEAMDNPEARRPTMRGFKIANADLTFDIRLARQQVAQLEAAVAQTPTRIPLGQLAPDSRLLESQVKLVTHAVRMSVYNAESALARLLSEHYSRADDEAHALLREAFQAAGDLQVRDDVLEVRLNPLSAPRRTRALAALCDYLTGTQTVYPSTHLRLVFTVKTPPGLA